MLVAVVGIGACLRHTKLVKSLVLSHVLHPGEVSQDLTLRQIGLISANKVDTIDELFLLSELLHKLLIWTGGTMPRTSTGM